MVLIQSLIQYLLLVLIFFGQLGRLDIFSLNFPIIDLVLANYTVILFINHVHQPRPKFSKAIFIFLTYSWLNLGIQYLYFHHNLVSPTMYLLRLSCLFMIFIFPPIITPKFEKAIQLTMLANILFGLFQYFFWPDLTYMKAAGWDDHLNRLVSTYFDPTFTGLAYLIFLIWIFHKQQKLMFIVTYLALVLTYSRSTYLSLLGASSFFSVFSKKPTLFLVTLLLVGLSIVSLPRKAGEGTKLERVSSINAKSENIQEGIELFKKHPLFGIGYNNIPYYKSSTPTSHSRGGYDSSLLNILITGGIVGSILFAASFFQLFLSATLISRTMFVAVLIHSLFANSLFYPHTTIILAFLYHLETISKYRK